MFYCGTSGFSYDDWAGIFYPEKLPKSRWLNYYAQEFNTVEINFTYYAMPQASTMKSLADRTGEGFLFAVKANQDMTHKVQQDPSVFRAFLEALGPMAEAKKLGCILAQFPYSFGPTEANFEYLNRFRGWMEKSDLVIEFRNVGWVTPKTLDWMKDSGIGFCCVDEPQLPRLLPPCSEVTSGTGYVRFHGRNTQKWWKHDEAWERYDYTYRTEELEEWLPRIAQIGKTAANTFIFANNHWKSQAVDTIRQVRSMLDQLVL